MLNLQFSAPLLKKFAVRLLKSENKKRRNKNTESEEACLETCVLKKKNTESNVWAASPEVIQIAGEKGGTPSNSIFPVFLSEVQRLCWFSKRWLSADIFPVRHFRVFAASRQISDLHAWNVFYGRNVGYVSAKVKRAKVRTKDMPRRSQDDINIVWRPLFLTESGNRRAGICDFVARRALRNWARNVPEKYKTHVQGIPKTLYLHF